MSCLRTTLYAGSGAALVSLTALALLSRAEGHNALRPLNATSHVIWGDDATREEVDLRRTLPGLLINVGAGFFWGSVYALLTRRPSERSNKDLAGRALVTSLLAAVVDYGLIPKRLRPGWELALKTRSVAVAFVAMGAGLAAGGLVARDADLPLENRRSGARRERREESTGTV